MGLMKRGDANAPQMLTVPSYGPDAISMRTSLFNALRANPASPRSWGIGVRPAPLGSVTEGTKTDAYLAPQQVFRGLVRTVVDPTLKTRQSTASFPAANVQVNPVLLAWSESQLNRRSLGG